MSQKKPVASPVSQESVWIESESIRLLMQPSPSIKSFHVLAMLVTAFSMYGHVNPVLILLWLAFSLLLLAYRVGIAAWFAKRIAHAGVDEQIKFINRHGLVWALNGMAWGMSGWLFFTNIPIQNQYICSGILTMVGFMTVHHLTPHRKFARQFINVLMGTQVAGALWYIGVVQSYQSPPIQYVYFLTLIFSWILLRVLNHQFYSSFSHDLLLQYRNTNLIDSLSRQTEQLELEKMVVLNANETIKRFYSSAAHDIRQPVYALNVYSDLITEDPAQTHKLIPKIKASCHAINALFDSLFDFEKIHSGQINVSLETVDLASLFRNLETHFLPQATAKSLDFRVMATAGRLQSDPALIKGILSHLITNAIKYTHQGGLLLAARKTAESISFEVWDTGIGIAGVHLAHVFEEFYKVNEQSSADEGFGLGLSVVKRLAAFVDDSSVTLQSRVGRGSVFKFRVPLAMYSNAHDQPHVPVQSQGKVSLAF